MTKVRGFNFLLGAVMASGVAIAATGCSSDLANPAEALCCKDFNVGADLSGADFGVEADFKGEFAVFAQAASDFGSVATATLNDLEGACRGIATDMGAPQADRDAADAKTGRDRTKAWCALAVGSINALVAGQGQFAGSASGTLSVQFDPPKCQASVSAKANCSAKCTVDGKCDIKANPPTCEGGKLEVACKGDCTAKAGAEVSCTGKCEGSCSGSCQAEGGVAVDCEGKCEGTCAAGGSANGSGAQADGSCKGTCSGKCTMSATAPKVTCKGTCSGGCSATCKGSATASVKCDGECKADYEPLKCSGGTLKGGCQVSADCNANCDASVSAKAECTPPAVTVKAAAQASLTGDASVKVTAAIDSLRANLPNIILALKARLPALKVAGEGLGNASVNVAGNTGKLGAKGVICAAAIAPVIAEAAGNVAASIEITASLGTALKI